MLTLAFQLIDDDYYYNVNGHVYEVLGYLKEPHKIEITDELVELLYFVIEKEKSISGPVC